MLSIVNNPNKKVMSNSLRVNHLFMHRSVKSIIIKNFEKLFGIEIKSAETKQF